MNLGPKTVNTRQRLFAGITLNRTAVIYDVGKILIVFKICLFKKKEFKAFYFLLHKIVVAVVRKRMILTKSRLQF